MPPRRIVLASTDRYVKFVGEVGAALKTTTDAATVELCVNLIGFQHGLKAPPRLPKGAGGKRPGSGRKKTAKAAKAPMTAGDLIATVPDLAGKLVDPKSIEAFVREILPKIESGEGFDFDGRNCESDSCRWDGLDRRCDCTNRRVEWIWSGSSWRGEAW